MLEIRFLNSWHWSICDVTVIMPTTAVSELHYINFFLQNFSPSVVVPYRFVWWSDSRGFSVKSAYLRLHSCVEQLFVSSSDLKVALKCVWKTIGPSNVQVFAWRLILNRLQTRDEFAKRGVISGAHSLVCPLCRRLEESHNHIFLHCIVVSQVWSSIFDWLWVNYIILKGRVKRICRIFIWLAEERVVWLIRNDTLFNGGMKGVREIVLVVKSLT